MSARVRPSLYGPVEADTFGGGGRPVIMMASPEYEVVEHEDAPGLHTGRVVAVYEKLGPLAGKTQYQVLL